jgi:ATP/maltotriose-dependent transcriptional regulator MalT
MRVCEELHQADPSHSFIRHCQTILQNSLSNVHFSAERYQLQPFALLEQPMQTIDEEFLPLFNEHVLEHPYVERMLTGSATEVSMAHQEPTLETFRQSTLYNEFYNKVQAQNQLWVGIEDGNELLTCIYSRETEYSENELAVMQIIQPHLETAWKNWRQMRDLNQELELLKETIFQTPEEEERIASVRRAIDALSPRRRDVIELVAVGKDNQQISDELKISILTVKKHLQFIFQALEVRHRTALAAKWHQAHSVSLY